MTARQRDTDKLRVGAVSYLNTKPLVYGLADIAPNIDLVFDLPSRLADSLSAGELDVALIPSIEAAIRHQQYQIISNACIACRGPVLSVKLFSRVAWDEIRTLALDEGSRTSAVMVQVLLFDRFGLRPDVELLPMGQGLSAATADAVLLIGDRAIHAGDRTGGQQWDLGQEWVACTGFPFVFAMWTARRGEDLGDVASALATARDAGLAHLEEISQAAADDVGMTPNACYHYLRDNLYFYLGREERRGFRHFLERASAVGLVSLGVDWEDQFIEMP